MKKETVLAVPVVAAAVLLGVVVSAVAEETKVTKDDQGRIVVREERPDSSRGWVVLSKEAYWPLAYEAMDKLGHVEQLIGSGKDEELATAIEKCAAWLGLASSAAMTHGKAGIMTAAERMTDAAEAIRDGGTPMSDEQLKQVVTLGYLCMAKSHVLRASDPDQEKFGERAARKTNVEKLVKSAEVEIAIERRKLRVAQFQHDAVESLRHLTVAQQYLEAAAKTGGLQLPSDVSDEIPSTLDSGDGADIATEFLASVRPRIDAMMEFCETERKRIVDAL